MYLSLEGKTALVMGEKVIFLVNLSIVGVKPSVLIHNNVLDLIH